MKKTFLDSKSALLKKRPLAVGTLVAGASVGRQLKLAKKSNIDLIEVRLDGFFEAQQAFQKAYEFGKGMIKEIKSKSGLPILLTFRTHDEQGSSRRSSGPSDATRAEILSRLLPAVELIDVEINHTEFARRMTVLARIHGKNTLHSTHDFSTPGNLKKLSALAALSNQLKGDIFKVAVTPKTNSDVETFLEWGWNLPNRNKVLIAMGEVGLISRFVGYSFGSLLTYGHLGVSAAPGQVHAGLLRSRLNEIYGD